MKEAGVADFDVSQWYGLFAPIGTSRNVIDRVYREVAVILKSADLQKRMAADGSDPVGSTTAEFVVHLRDEVVKWKKVLDRAGIKSF